MIEEMEEIKKAHDTKWAEAVVENALQSDCLSDLQFAYELQFGEPFYLFTGCGFTSETAKATMKSCLISGKPYVFKYDEDVIY